MVQLSYTKQELFARPAAGELRQNDIIYARGGLHVMAREIDALSPDESYCIRGGLLNDMSPRYYKKHAPVIDISDAPGATPRKRLEYAVARSRVTPASGYGWRGTSDDKRLRVVPLVKLLEGAKLFAYESGKPGSDDPAGARLYDDTVKVEEQGGIAVVRVSRRTGKQEQHNVVISGIPIEDGSTWRRVSTHSTCCLDNLYSDVRYDRADDPERKTFCAHEVVGYWKAAAALYRKHGEETAARFSPFVAPSQRLVDFYQRLSRQTFVQERQRGRAVYRLTNQAEMEKLLLTYVRDNGFAASFSGRGKLADRRWVA